MKFIKYLASIILAKELQVLKNTIAQQEDIIQKELPKSAVSALPRAIFSKFKERFERPIVSGSTSGEQAGYLVGIQRVLTELERDHVV